MYKSERQSAILKILRQKQYATVEQLSKDLFTSISSVRRDLIELEREHLVIRSYGSVELVKSNSRTEPYSLRAQRRIEEKRCIARKAAVLVKDKDIVFLDQSNTSLFLAQELVQDKKITIITNNLDILGSVYSQNNITIYSSSGLVATGHRCLIGDDAEATFNRIHADFAFFSVKALSSDGVLYDANLPQVLVREAMINNAQKKVLLCDSEKYDTFAGYRQCSLDEIDYLVSETEPTDRWRSYAPDLIVL